MTEQAAPPAEEYRATVTLTLPVEMVRRLHPFTSRRARSAFIEQAIAAALDKADQDQGQDREPERV
jgi:predicted transcriptional regulator